MENVLRLVQRADLDVKEREVRARDAEKLRGELKEVAKLMACNDLWFQLECDGDLIDACIYQRGALEARYRHLLALARREELCVPFQAAVK